MYIHIHALLDGWISLCTRGKATVFAIVVLTYMSICAYKHVYIKCTYTHFFFFFVYIAVKSLKMTFPHWTHQPGLWLTPHQVAASQHLRLKTQEWDSCHTCSSDKRNTEPHFSRHLFSHHHSVLSPHYVPPPPPTRPTGVHIKLRQSTDNISCLSHLPARAGCVCVCVLRVRASERACAGVCVCEISWYLS